MQPLMAQKAAVVKKLKAEEKKEEEWWNYAWTGDLKGMQRLIKEVVDEILSNGNKATSLILDMRETSTFSDKVAAVVDQFKHIDILINNAAVSVDQPFFEVDEDNWDRHLDTNLKGLFFLSQAVAAQMRNQQGYKSIINIIIHSRYIGANMNDRNRKSLE